jgi:hypothetical protein
MKKNDTYIGEKRKNEKTNVSPKASWIIYLRSFLGSFYKNKKTDSGEKFGLVQFLIE